MGNTADLKVGIVGCGRMGRERARAATVLGAKVDIFVDTEVSRARTLAAEQAGSRAVDDIDDIDWSKLDAIFVCTPPGQRGLVEEHAAACRLPVFMEKPIGLCASTCAELAGRFLEQGIIHSVGYTNRYRSSVRRTRRLLDTEQPLGVACQWVGAAYRVPWWLEREQSGGPINEQATHLVDLCRFLIGEIDEVAAISRDQSGASARGNAVEAAVAVNLRFARGILGTLFYSCEANQKQIGATIFLPDRSVKLDGWSFADRSLDNSYEDERQDVYISEVEAFFEGVLSADQSKIHSSLSDAIRTQLVVDTIFESMTAGRFLPVPSGDYRA
jgi:predicted dehydrogenase